MDKLKVLIAMSNEILDVDDLKKILNKIIGEEVDLEFTDSYTRLLEVETTTDYIMLVTDKLHELKNTGEEKDILFNTMTPVLYGELRCDAIVSNFSEMIDKAIGIKILSQTMRKLKEGQLTVSFNEYLFGGGDIDNILFDLKDLSGNVVGEINMGLTEQFSIKLGEDKCLVDYSNNQSIDYINNEPGPYNDNLNVNNTVSISDGWKCRVNEPLHEKFSNIVNNAFERDDPEIWKNFEPSFEDITRFDILDTLNER